MMIADEPEVFELTPLERNSALWARLLAHLKEKLAAARAKNDGDQDLIVTAKLRGQIGTLKALIELNEDLSTIE